MAQNRRNSEAATRSRPRESGTAAPEAASRGKARPSKAASWEVLQKRLGVKFNNAELLYQALTHSSWCADRHAKRNDAGQVRDYEVLEFLGDAVLGLRASERLMQTFPDSGEGALTRSRSWLVSARHLTKVARELQLGAFLRLSHGEEAIGGRDKERILANVMEAVIGAIHLDAGYAVAARFIDRFILSDLEKGTAPARLDEFSYKSALQEWAHKEGLALPRYRLLQSTGPEHQKLFLVEVSAGDCRAEASANTKKQAEQWAAKGALRALGVIEAD